MSCNSSPTSCPAAAGRVGGVVVGIAVREPRLDPFGSRGVCGTETAVGSAAGRGWGGVAAGTGQAECTARSASGSGASGAGVAGSGGGMGKCRGEGRKVDDIGVYLYRQHLAITD